MKLTAIHIGPSRPTAGGRTRGAKVLWALCVSVLTWLPAAGRAQSNALRISGITAVNRTNVLIQWQGATGSVWVQRKTSDLPEWADISPALATNRFVTPIDTTARGAVIYRLRGSGYAASRPQLTGFLSAVGIAHDVVTRSNVAYLASDSFGLSLVSVSNAAAPTVIASANLPFNGLAVHVADTLACVTGNRTSSTGGPLFTNLFGVYVIDVSSNAPVVRGMIEGNDTSFYGVAISNKRAYVACGSAGLRVVDLSNPAQPQFIGTNDTPGFAGAVTVAGNFAYVADGAMGVRILSITNPAVPVSVGSYDTPGSAKDVAIVGNFAYVADGSSVQVLDISNPAAPVFRGSIAVPALKVRVQGSVVYVAGMSQGLMLLSASHPTNLVPLGVLPPAGNPNASTLSVSVSGNFAYLANREGGIVIANVTVPSQPSVSGTLMEWFQGYKLAATGGWAVVTGTRCWDGGARTASGLRVLSLSNAAAPAVIGRLDSATVAFYGVALAGNHAYVSCGAAGLCVVDLGARSQPRVIGTNDTPGFAHGVAVAGGFAYVADGQAGLRVMSLSNPAAPVSVGWLDTPGSAKDVTIAGNLAYVADNSSVQIIDISNPLRPVARGSFPVAAQEVRVQNNVAYVAVASIGLVILDVGNPASPTQVAVLPPSGNVNASTLGVAVAGNRAYLANREGGLAIVDVSAPARPVLLRAVSTLANAFSVVADGDWSYLSDSLGSISTVSSAR